MTRYIPILVLAIVFILTAIRRIGSYKLKIWQVMLVGASAVLLTGGIAPLDAAKAINLDVIIFLFGMFVIGRALEDSGYLEHLLGRFFGKTKSVDGFVLAVMLVFGLMSALVMNDTMAIVGTPAVLMLSKQKGINAKMLMLALAFSVTIGSVASPIGNPQNLLIAMGSNMGNPFFAFGSKLIIPTIINLIVAFFILKFFFRKFQDAEKKQIEKIEQAARNTRLENLSKTSLLLVGMLVLAKVVLVAFRLPFDFKLTYIAIVAMLPILIFSRDRFSIIKRIDWQTLVFFASMFVLMQSVWNSGVFQELMNGSGLNFASVPVILVISLVFSQFLSNVPLVALYLPVLGRLGASQGQFIALAAGSTVAGNMFILGAASTVIIIENAERRTGDTITFAEFAKIGVPLTAVNVLVYWIFLSF
ncbi:MAG: anion transporter [Caldiserica bacterium]|nr:anion transporter [Caldisericota bacterium]